MKPISDGERALTLGQIAGRTIGKTKSMLEELKRHLDAGTMKVALFDASGSAKELAESAIYDSFISGRCVIDRGYSRAALADDYIENSPADRTVWGSMPVGFPKFQFHSNTLLMNGGVTREDAKVIEHRDTEVIAWRGWNCTTGRDFFLESPSQGTRWHGPVLHAHEKPELDNGCGVYGLAEAAWLESGYVGSCTVFGEIALSGRVVEGPHGWRGEVATIRSLKLKPPPQGPEDREEAQRILSERYGVEVELLPWADADRMAYEPGARQQKDAELEATVIAMIKELDALRGKRGLVVAATPNGTLVGPLYSWAINHDISHEMTFELRGEVEKVIP